MSRRKSRGGVPLGPPEILTVELTGLSPEGAATGRHGDEEIHAMYGLPGERADVEVWERRDGRIYGRVLRVLRPSPDRVEAPCPYFTSCGGCQWQHVANSRQLAFKRDGVAAHLAAAGFADAPVLPTVPAPETYGYRNHGRFSVGKRYGELGYTTRHRHRFFRVDHCPIMHPRINEILAATQGRGHGHQLAVRVGVNTGDLLAQPSQEREEDAHLPPLPYASGQEYLEEELLGRRYRVSAAAFFQVNTHQAECLIETVGALLDPAPDDVLLDLYCGVGTFGLALAPCVGRVIGIEESAAALKDARHNACTQGVENVEFLAGKTEDVLAGLQGQADAVIVDPPRSGCRPEALAALLRLRPRKLAYVSCEPATLARDLRVLVNGGFTLRSIQPVDMFPQTSHVETVTLLTSR